MKKLFLLTTLLLTTFIAINAQNIGAEWRALLRQEGYTIAEEKYASLAEGETAYYYRTFYSDLEYAIIAYSDEYGVLDVDVYLYDEDGSLLVKDVESDSEALVEYMPYVSREMKIVVKNYDSESSYAEYDIYLIIAYF